MISAIKSDNPIELLNFISNTFLECIHECASTSLAFSLIQTVSLFPLNTCPSDRQSASQSVCHVVILPLNQRQMPRWPLARIGMAHICLFDIVAHLVFIYIFPRFSYQNVKWISMYFQHLLPHTRTFL